MKKIMMPLMLFLLVVGWSTTISNYGKANQQFEQHMEQAQGYEEKEIYVDALTEYTEAIKYTKEPYNIHLKVMEMYAAMKRYSEFVDYGEVLLKDYGYPEEVVKKLVDYYKENNKKRYAIEVLNRAIKEKKGNEYFVRQLEELRGTYTMTYLGKDEVYTYYRNYARFKDKEKYGLISQSGTETIRASYEMVTPYADEPELATVHDEDEWYCIDKQGYKKLVSDQAVEELGMFGEGYIVFKIDGRYGYMNDAMEVVQSPCWEAAGVFSEGVAPVKKDGKWYLIDTDFQVVGTKSFDEIVMSEYGVATQFGVFFAKQKDTYQLYDLTCEPLTQQSFDEVSVFVSEQPAAVCINGKWGFVSLEGTMEIEPQYEQAMSFSRNLAPVLVEGQWGYIDDANIVRIAPTFGQAYSFSERGTAPVFSNGWQLIKLIQ